MSVRQDQRGFTLVELLIVIMVIALLAAIALPAFLNQGDKADDAGVKSQLKTAAFVLEEKAAVEGGYQGTDVDDLLAAEPVLREASGLALSTAPRTFRVEADSKSGVHYVLERLPNGAMRRDCAPAGSGGCMADPQGANRW